MISTHMHIAMPSSSCSTRDRYVGGILKGVSSSMAIRKKKTAQLKLLVANYNDSAPIYCLLLVWTSNWMP